jgi:phosphoglycerate dehydrogenase-like enzyme
MSRRGVSLAHQGFNVLPRLSSLLPEDEVVTVYVGEDMSSAAGVTAGIGGLSGERLQALLAVAPGLRWYHTVSAGVDQLLIPEVRSRARLVITNGRGAYDGPVAEHVIAFIVAASRRLPDAIRAQSRHEWGTDPGIRDIGGSTLIVVGMGSIGRQVARLARGLGMDVIGFGRRQHGTVKSVDDLPRAIGEADFVALCVPFTNQTTNVINASMIARMRPSAWIVNVSRGPVIDEAALFAACAQRAIGGAALDVWWEEPLPATSRWWDLPNVIITPHIANSSPRLYQRSLDIVLENLRRFRLGLRLKNVVDKRHGY